MRSMLGRMWLGSAAYFALFFALGYDRYAAHRSAEDLGIFYQSIASAFAGFGNTIENASHLSVHFSPVLYLFAPLVWLAHSPLPLIAVQAAANAVVAPALFLVARRRVPERVAAAIACVAFFYPPLCGVTFADFHENGLVTGTIAWLLYALDARKFALAGALAALALLIKEDQAVFVATVALGAVWYFQRSGEPRGVRWGLAILLLSISAVAAFFLVVRPLAGAHDGWHPAVFYTQTKPDAQVGLVRAVTDRLGYLVLAFAPLAFLPFRSRALWLAVIPFAELLLSRAPVTYTMGQHYAAVWIPYVLVSFVLAACHLYARRPAILERALYAAYAACALVFIVANPLHPRYFLRVPTADDANLDRFIAGLPLQLELGTQEEAYTHMGFYPNATLGIERYPQYALFDWRYPQSNWVIRDGPKIRAAVRARQYRLVRQRDGIALYVRVIPKPRHLPQISPAW